MQFLITSVDSQFPRMRAQLELIQNWDFFFASRDESNDGHEKKLYFSTWKPKPLPFSDRSCMDCGEIIFENSIAASPCPFDKATFSLCRGVHESLSDVLRPNHSLSRIIGSDRWNCSRVVRNSKKTQIRDYWRDNAYAGCEQTSIDDRRERQLGSVTRQSAENCLLQLSSDVSGERVPKNERHVALIWCIRENTEREHMSPRADGGLKVKRNISTWLSLSMTLSNQLEVSVESRALAQF